MCVYVCKQHVHILIHILLFAVNAVCTESSYKGGIIKDRPFCKVVSTYVYYIYIYIYICSPNETPSNTKVIFLKLLTV